MAGACFDMAAMANPLNMPMSPRSAGFCVRFAKLLQISSKEIVQESSNHGNRADLANLQSCRRDRGFNDVGREQKRQGRHEPSVEPQPDCLHPSISRRQRKRCPHSNEKRLYGRDDNNDQCHRLDGAIVFRATVCSNSSIDRSTPDRQLCPLYRTEPAASASSFSFSAPIEEPLRRLTLSAPAVSILATRGRDQPMHAWAVVENGAPLRQIELPTPEPKGTEVLIEVTHCGVCHSDLHIWEGYYDIGGGKKMSLKDRGVTLPLAMGHEIVGRVAKLGPEATGVKPGNLRIVFPWVSCGTCAACQAEEDNMCLTPRSLGVYQNGGYGTHVIAPHPRHLVDPGTLDPAVAATYACSGITVYSAIRKLMPIAAAEPIVLIGAGGLGMNAIAVLRALRHRNIIVVDISEEKRRAALSAGATKAVDSSGPDVAKHIMEAAGGPVLGIVDLVNGTATAASAFAALRKGGKLVQVGLFGGELTLPLPLMAIRALTVQGSYVGNPKELRELVKLAQEGTVPPLPVATVPQSHANEALMRLRDGNVTGRLVLHAEAA
jgi:alcohol dehydrogenase, propanol-preferring